MKRLLLTGAALFAAAILPVTSHAAGTIKIGVVLPYSGQFADGAKQVDEGIKLYMKQHGDTVAGKKIEIIRKDVGGIAPPVAKRLARRTGRARQGRHPGRLAVDAERDRRLRRIGRGQESLGHHERRDLDHRRQVALLHARGLHAADGDDHARPLGRQERHQESLHDDVRLRAGP